MRTLKERLAGIPLALKFRYFLSAFRAPLRVIIHSNSILKEYKDRYLGKRCFIIGNGPSLSALDLEKIKGEISFGANCIYKIFSQTLWRPTFYCVQDEQMLLEMERNDLLSTSEKVQMTFIRMHSYHKMKKNRIKISKICYVPIFLDRTNPSAGEFSKNAQKFIYDGGTVTYMSIQLAAYMGFSEIYLLGVDHNYPYRISLSGESIENDLNLMAHFYDTADSKSQNTTGNYYEYVTNSYQAAEEYSRKNGTFRIYNATRGGVLEVFERVELDKILSVNKKQE